jgi:hypothetical protein
VASTSALANLDAADALDSGSSSNASASPYSMTALQKLDAADSASGSAPSKRTYVSPVDNPATRSGQGGVAGTVTDAVDAAAGNLVQGAIGGIGGGYRGLIALLRGKGMDEAADTINDYVAKTAYQPTSPTAQKTTAAMDSPWNPLNLPKTVGQGLGRGAEYVGAPPAVSAALEVAPTAATALWGMRGVPRGGGTPLEGAPTPKVTALAPGEDPTLVPALRSSTASSPASSAPGTGAAPGPNLSIAPSAPRTMPSSTPTTAAPNLSLAPGQPRALPSTPVASPGASVDLSLEPSAPRSVPGSTPATSTASAPPLTATGLPRGQLWEPVDVPSKPGTRIDSEPVAGGLPPDAQASRAAILQRVGLNSARDSALRGDAMSAATDAQMSRFDEPAGQAAKAQFEAEKAALQQHAQGIITRAGGTVGTDEDALNSRGQTVANAFDSYRDWFDQQRKALYDAADTRAGGAPVTKLEGVDTLLQDPTFRNTLLAKDQGGLLSSVANQLEEFRKQSPQGFSAQGAEQVRQWLNQVWTPDNRFAVGQIKDAVDNDVMKGAGEDIYGPARAFSRLKSQTLDNPNGVARLFDKDPQTPLNRVTPYVKIPDAIQRMDPENFRNVLRTLQDMPSDIQPEAQAAIGEIKGHLANKLLDGGTMKAPEAQWNAPNVNQAIQKNRAKLNIAFGNDAQAVQDIRDLQSAGNILRANAQYPGAAAQAANALKRGMMTRALQTVGATGGAALGSYLGPMGAAAGAAAGETLAGRATQSMGERAALNRWESGVTKLSDLMKPQAGPSNGP